MVIANKHPNYNVDIKKQALLTFNGLSSNKSINFMIKITISLAGKYKSLINRRLIFPPAL
jgi:hypothetical protein